MDIVRIDPTIWDADELVEIEDGGSTIWTERFQAPGEFQIKTKKIDYVKNLIPKGSLIGERNSQEVMIVENHSIEDTEDGPELTTTGRTFEAFFENRATVVVKTPAGQEAMWTYKADDIWPTDAAKALIMSHVTVCTEAPSQQVPGTAVENLVTTHNDEELSYENEPGELYAQVLSLLQMESAGIRNQLDDAGHLKIYIYKGLSRTVNQDVRPQVVFSVGADHLVDTKYLWTLKDYKNVAYVVGTAWQQRVYAPGVSTSVTGLDRRILVVNGDEIKNTSSEAKKTKQAKALGLAALAKQNQTLFFEGEVSPESPYIRGVDYNLGDLVTLVGQYGVSQTMLINEFTRTSDEEGDKSFPTLVVPSDVSDDA